MLQNFLNLREIYEPLFQRLKKNSSAWYYKHIQIVIYIKCKVNSLPCRDIPNSYAFMIIEIDASNNSVGRILKQCLEPNSKQLVRFHSGAWPGLQIHYFTIKKDLLSIVLCIPNFKLIYISKFSY